MSTATVHLDAGGLLLSKTKVDAEATEQVVARAYRHPALADRPVIRLASDRLGEAEDLAMEFLGFVDGVKNVSTAWAIAAGTGTPRAKATIVADVFHMMRGGGSVDDLLTIKGDRLANFHINDLPADPDPLVQRDEDRVMVGEGIADLPRVIANLRSIGYRGPLSLELFNRKLWEQDPFEVVKLGLERIRGLVE